MRRKATLTILLGLGLAMVSGVVAAAKDQNSSVSYNVTIRDSKLVSATALTSSDTEYVESKCVGGKLTFAGLFTDRRGRRVEQIVIYKVQFFNKGTDTIDASALFFTEDFTSPGDNTAWVLGDGAFALGYRGRVDIAMAEIESGDDVYGESVETNMVLRRGSDGNVYVQVVKNGAAPIAIGGDTRSASADFVVRLFVHQPEK